ncbi:MAG: (2Fe-2S)-binding protein [Proteobacteria bacterium]|nr:(2Fe-2S)-binding protein [Pseudomonadota bacterium]
MAMTVNRAGQFVRLGETSRASVLVHIDGEAVSCLAGDTVLTALLLHGRLLRISEFGDGPRAGFCNMGACQDCWVSLEDGERRRACTTYVQAGQRVLSQERP